METVVFLLTIFLIIGIFIGIGLFVAISFNKLKTYQLQCNKLWNDLRLHIESVFKYVESNYKNDSFICELVNHYKILAYKGDVMEAYLKLENLMENKKDPFFIKKVEEINNLRVEYNNVLLKYDNYIKMIPFNLIAKTFKFKPDLYFRSNK